MSYKEMLKRALRVTLAIGIPTYIAVTISTHPASVFGAIFVSSFGLFYTQRK